MDQLFQFRNWLAGIQWFFFMFANTVIIPIMIGAAFGLPQKEVVPLLQMSFIVTGLACFFQVLVGHKKPIMEGQSGLWIAVFLTLIATSSAQGVPLHEVGGSFALGVIISGILTILIGVLGIGPRLASLFNESVMGVFMVLLGLTLMQIFIKGMLGLPFGATNEPATIHLAKSAVSIFIIIVVILISIKSSKKVRNYALLIGIILGWVVYTFFFGIEKIASDSSVGITLFPFGQVTWNTGIVFTAVVTGILNISNTYGALLGTDGLLNKQTTKREYAATFSITGITNVISGFFGLIPYAPYVSSIGFLRQTAIYDRLPFMIGSFLFFTMGLIKPIGTFFSMLPLSIGCAVLFVAFLQFFHSSLEFFKKVTFNGLNIYRSAIPFFVGAIIMTLPASVFASLPTLIEPFVSNGLLVGILLAVVLENVFNWDKIGQEEQK